MIGIVASALIPQNAGLAFLLLKYWTLELNIKSLFKSLSTLSSNVGSFWSNKFIYTLDNN